MAKRTEFHVHAYPGEMLGKFVHEYDAQRVAQMWSARWGSWTEVRYTGKKGAGLIGQFSKGVPTPEFAHLQTVADEYKQIAA
jgi:hypothetical protein